MHPHHQHILIVGAVQHADLAPGRNGLFNAPQIVVAQLDAVGSLERVNLQGLRVQRGKNVLDEAVLSGSIPGLHGEDQPLLPCGIQLFLQYSRFAQVFLRAFLQFGLLGLEGACICGCFLQAKLLRTVVEIGFCRHAKTLLCLE